MRTILLLAVCMALSFSIVVRTPVKKSNLLAKMVKEGTLKTFMAKKLFSNAVTRQSGKRPFVDFNDELYIADIKLGDPAQHFKVVLDTKSADLWVVDYACNSDACKQKSRFQPSKSSDFKFGASDYKIDSTTGFSGYDTLHLDDGLYFNPQGFGILSDVPSQYANSQADGVLGLGWPSLSQNGITPPMQNILLKLDHPLFTIWLDRHVSPAQGDYGGWVTFGAIDTANCDLRVDYVTLSAKSYWQFLLQGFKIGSYSTNQRTEAISDTGSAFIGGPQTAITAIQQATGANYDFGTGMYTLHCSGKYPDMVFTIGGKLYTIPSSEYVIDVNLGGGKCALTVFVQNGGGFQPDWVMGDPWIRSYCNIYDIGNGRIGFAKAHHSEI